MSVFHHTSEHCQHVNARGRRCRMLRATDRDQFCAQHARLEAQALASDLLGPDRDFSTAISVNRVLGNLLELTASDRIPPRRAALVAYTCQLLLTSLPEVKNELDEAEDEEETERRYALWSQNPQPLPATPQAFAEAVFERAFGTKPPAANLPPAPCPPHSGEPKSQSENAIK